MEVKAKRFVTLIHLCELRYSQLIHQCTYFVQAQLTDLCRAHTHSKMKLQLQFGKAAYGSKHVGLKFSITLVMVGCRASVFFHLI